jgi:hypothetical protein
MKFYEFNTSQRTIAVCTQLATCAFVESNRLCPVILHFFNIHFNINLPTTSRSSKCFLPKSCMNFPFPPCVLYIQLIPFSFEISTAEMVFQYYDSNWHTSISPPHKRNSSIFFRTVSEFECPREEAYSLSIRTRLRSH